MFLVNSRFPLASATPPSSHRKGCSPDGAPLLPKLRGQFAEFLNHGSPDRLGILYLTTCVGLGYGPHTHSLEAFLGSTGSLTSPKTARHHLSPSIHHGFTYGAGYGLTPGNHHLVELPSCVTPSLTYYQIRSHHRPPSPRRDQDGFTMVSFLGFGLVACVRVREYQPVVHRLRLSASP